MWEKKIDWLPLTHGPQLGLNPQPRHAPQLGVNMVTLHFVGWCPTTWAIQVRAGYSTFEDHSKISSLAWEEISDKMKQILFKSVVSPSFYEIQFWSKQWQSGASKIIPVHWSCDLHSWLLPQQCPRSRRCIPLIWGIRNCQGSLLTCTEGTYVSALL